MMRAQDEGPRVAAWESIQHDGVSSRSSDRSAKRHIQFAHQTTRPGSALASMRQRFVSPPRLFMEQPSFNTYRFDEFRLDLNSICLLDGKGEQIELTRREFEALKYLCEHPWKLITKEELIQEVWQRQVEEGNVKSCISAIRKKLGEKGKTIIYTRHGLGYRLECNVEAIQDDSDAEERTAGVDAPDNATPTHESDAGPAPSERLPDEPEAASFNVAVETLAEQETEKGPTPAAELIAEAQKAADDIADKRGLQRGQGKTVPERVGSDDASDDSDKTFEQWLSGPGWLISLVLLVCVVIAFVLSRVALDSGQGGDNDLAMQVASRVQCVVLILMLLHSLFWIKAKGLRSKEDCSRAAIAEAGFKDEATYETERISLENNLKKYIFWWRLLLLSWIALYVVFGAGKFSGHKVYLLVFNLVNTFMLGACFNSLNKNVDEKDREHFAGWVFNVVTLVIFMGVLADRLVDGDLDGATLLTGIMAGITMALYIGRLQSRFLGPRFWILYFLYSYTAIQPLVLYIDYRPQWGWKILTFALVLKCLLYIYMTWLFQSGLLLFYFASVKRTDNALPSQRGAFRELLSKHPLK